MVAIKAEASRWADGMPAAAERNGAAGAPAENPSLHLPRLLAPAGSTSYAVGPSGPKAGSLFEAAEPAPHTLARQVPALVRLYRLPSPCPDRFDVDFWLAEPADAHLDVFDARGRKVLGVIRRRLAGNSPHRISLALEGLGLPPDTYICQLRVLGVGAEYAPPGAPCQTFALGPGLFRQPGPETAPAPVDSWLPYWAKAS